MVNFCLIPKRNIYPEPSVHHSPLEKLRGQRFGPMEIRMFIWGIISKRVTILIGTKNDWPDTRDGLTSEFDSLTRGFIFMFRFNARYDDFTQNVRKVVLVDLSSRGPIGARLERGPDSRINNPSINVPGKTVKMEGVGATIPA